MANPHPQTAHLTPFTSETAQAASEKRWGSLRARQEVLVEQAARMGLAKADVRELTRNFKKLLTNAEKERLMREAQHSAYRDLTEAEYSALALSVLAKAAHAGSPNAARALDTAILRRRELGMGEEALTNMGLLNRDDRLAAIEAVVVQRESRLRPQEVSDGEGEEPSSRVADGPGRDAPG